MAPSTGRVALINPADARHEIPGGGGVQTAQQIDRPPLLLTRLRIPCACGLRLIVTQYLFIADTLHIRGVCLACGEQRAIFAPPREGENEEAEMASIASEIITMVDDVMARRAHLALVEDDRNKELIRAQTRGAA